MTKEEKQAKIAEVRANLDSHLQTLFDAYTSVSNPQLKKKLEDNNTDWREVLTKWQSNKEKKASKTKTPRANNPKTLIKKIEEALKTDSYDSLKDALTLCDKLKKVINNNRNKKKADKRASLQAQLAELDKED